MTATLERVCTSGICSPRRAPAARSTPGTPCRRSCARWSRPRPILDAGDELGHDVRADDGMSRSRYCAAWAAPTVAWRKRRRSRPGRPEVELLQRLPVGPLRLSPLKKRPRTVTPCGEVLPQARLAQIRLAVFGAVGQQQHAVALRKGRGEGLGRALAHLRVVVEHGGLRALDLRAHGDQREADPLSASSSSCWPWLATTSASAPSGRPAPAGPRAGSPFPRPACSSARGCPCARRRSARPRRVLPVVAARPGEISATCTGSSPCSHPGTSSRQSSVRASALAT